MRQRLSFLCAAVLVLAGIHMAIAQSPTTRPTDDRLSQLISRLGDDDYTARQAAQDELRQLGREALPALRQAAKSADPEVSSRAEALIKQIEMPPRSARRDTMPDVPGMNGIVIAPGNIRQEIRLQVVGPNQVRNATIRENNRTTTIREDTNGIQMTVTEPGKDGQPETKEYKAATADELKKDHPDAFAIYDRFKARQVQMPKVNLRRPPMPQSMQRLLRQNDRRLARLLTVTPNADRFGIEAEDADAAIQAQLGAGAMVSDVQPNSRAEKLGLNRHDLIQKVNDKKIESVQDLEDALDAEGPMAMEIIRAGKSLKLQEEKSR